MNVKRKFVKNTMDMIFLPICETSLFYGYGEVVLSLKSEGHYVGHDYDSEGLLVKTFEYTSYRLLEDHIEFIDGGSVVEEYGYPLSVTV